MLTMTGWNQNIYVEKKAHKGPIQDRQRLSYKYISGSSLDAYTVYMRIKKLSHLHVVHEIHQKAKIILLDDFKK